MAGPDPKLFLHVGEELVTIGAADDRDVRVPASFSAVYELRGVGVVTLAITAERGRTRVTHVEVNEIEDQGITGLRAGKVPVADLLERAVATMSYLSSTAGLPGTRQAARKATRRRVSDDRLERVADLYREGGAGAVMDEEAVGERQAYRLVRLAREAGLLGKGGER
jgi:hypothetical protein